MYSLQKAFLLICALFLLPTIASADTLRLLPNTGSYEVGKTISVTAYVSSSQSVNAVSGTVTFPTDKLQVVSLSKAGSVLTLWVTEPTFSNTTGTVSFEGVVPNPGFIGAAGTIVTINFKVIGQGEAPVKLSTGSVLANDGNGTNILKNLLPASFTLGPAQAVPVIPTVQPETTPVKTSSLAVTSKEFPDQKKWYSLNSGTFTWLVHDKVTAVRTLLGKLPDSTPTVVYEPPTEFKKIDDLGDGTWYFHLQVKSDGTWGVITHYRVQIDTTAPESFTIKQIQSDEPTDPTPAFEFAAIDATSGIHHYTISIDRADPIEWRADSSNIYIAPLLGPGKHSFLVKAYDEAGNSTPASIDFSIVPIEAPQITFNTENVKEGGMLIISGTAPANQRVEISLTKAVISGNENILRETVKTDSAGSWNAVIDSSQLGDGAYQVTAVTVDDRGARSEPTAEKTILIHADWLQSIGSSLTNTLAILVPIIALLVLLFLALQHGIHRAWISKRKFQSDLHRVEHLVGKAFMLLKDDIEDSIRLLERAKSKRRLTKEEDLIIERLRANLNDAEEAIHGEVKKIEKEIN